MGRGWYLNGLKHMKGEFARENRRGLKRLETLRGMNHPVASDQEALIEMRNGWIKQLDAEIEAVTNGEGK